MAHPRRFSTTETEDFYFTKFIFSACYSYHFGGADVKAYNDGLFFFAHIASFKYLLLNAFIDIDIWVLFVFLFERCFFYSCLSSHPVLFASLRFSQLLLLLLPSLLFLQF